MASNNFGGVIIILVIISLIHIFLTFSIGISEVKNNWSEYKCNPGIIPIASLFGYDTATNFSECIQSTQVDFMSSFLEPVYSSLRYFATIGATFTNVFEDLKLFGDIQDETMGSFAETVGEKIFGVVDATDQVFMDTKDTFNKMSSSLSVLYHGANAGINGANYLWNELPGTMIRMGS